MARRILEAQRLAEVVSKRAVLKIAVIGIGGCGCNTISNLERAGIDVPTVAVNTDAAVLYKTKAKYRVLIGETVTRGRGSAGSPALGREIMSREAERVLANVRDAELYILTAGLGGGTGTGGILALAEYIKENMGDKLVWAVVTTPFSSEGAERVRNAKVALAELLDLADVILVNFNDILKQKMGSRSLQQAFREMDKHLVTVITALTSLQYTEPTPGLVNIDFSNVERLTRRSGLGFVGVGQGSRLFSAFENALEQNYCEADLTGAKGAVIYMEGTQAMLKTSEVEEMTSILATKYGISTIFWGVRYNWKLYNPRVMLMAAGVKSPLVDQYLEVK
ncbi:MAG: hypothetical protein DRN04_10630 [Thermoprotei archaeon]|nr:MAG: hypothetical protein DRN04_10630 [Thermoprotei archaeon]